MKKDLDKHINTLKKKSKQTKEENRSMFKKIC